MSIALDIYKGSAQTFQQEFVSAGQPQEPSTIDKVKAGAQAVRQSELGQKVVGTAKLAVTHGFLPTAMLNHGVLKPGMAVFDDMYSYLRAHKISQENTDPLAFYKETEDKGWNVQLANMGLFRRSSGLEGFIQAEADVKKHFDPANIKLGNTDDAPSLKMSVPDNAASLKTIETTLKSHAENDEGFNRVIQDYNNNLAKLEKTAATGGNVTSTAHAVINQLMENNTALITQVKAHQAREITKVEALFSPGSDSYSQLKTDLQAKNPGLSDDDATAKIVTIKESTINNIKERHREQTNKLNQDTAKLSESYLAVLNQKAAELAVLSQLIDEKHQDVYREVEKVGDNSDTAISSIDGDKTIKVNINKALDEGKVKTRHGHTVTRTGNGTAVQIKGSTSSRAMQRDIADQVLIAKAQGHKTLTFNVEVNGNGKDNEKTAFQNKMLKSQLRAALDQGYKRGDLTFKIKEGGQAKTLTTNQLIERGIMTKEEVTARETIANNKSMGSQANKGTVKESDKTVQKQQELRREMQELRADNVDAPMPPPLPQSHRGPHQ